MAKHYNFQVRHKDFKVGDLVLRKVIGAARDHTREAWPQLGMTLSNHVMAEEGHLPPGDDKQTEAATSMEHRALTKVLPVRRMT